MNRAACLALDAFCGALPRAASLLVPGPQRCDWLREWRAELWHARREAGSQAALDLCLGAVPDALELRRIAREAQPRRVPLHYSAVFCLLLLVAVLASGWIFALRSPAIVAERHPERYAVRPGLVMIKGAQTDSDIAPTISIANYRQWAGVRQRYFGGMAFYRIESMRLLEGSRPVARASSSLFSLLGLPMQLGSAAQSSQSRLVLSDLAWRRDFSADPLIVGRAVRLDGRLVPVAAVLPNGGWRMPGEPDAWLLEPERAIPAGAPGFVVAQLKDEGWMGMWNGRINIQAYNTEGGDLDLWAFSFDNRARGPLGIFLLATLLALLSLPALTSVSLPDEPHSTSCHGHRIAARLFYAAKFVLILGILYIVPIDLAYWRTPGFEPGASSIHLVLSLALGIFGFWWAVADQSRRCPVCLRRVAHPARVGIASRTFLAWNGTELFCSGGHTLLEVPGLPTSWFSTPRWVYLDSSWQFLFAA